MVNASKMKNMGSSGADIELRDKTQMRSDEGSFDQGQFVSTDVSQTHKYAFGAWSATLAIVSCAVGVYVGSTGAADKITGGSSTVSAGTTVESVDLTETMENLRRRSLLVDEWKDSTFDGSRQLALKHNTAYYDTIASVTVTKENGWVYTFGVNSYKILPDTSLVFYGSNSEELSYPADNSGWALTGGEAAFRAQGAKSGGRRLGASNAIKEERPVHEEFIDRMERKLAGKSSLCDGQLEGKCKSCIESEDPWCAGSAWDSWCQAGCEGPTQYMANGCLEACKEPAIISVKAKKVAEFEEKVPVNCAVDTWVPTPNSCAFSQGSMQCFSKQTRTVVTHAAHGGEPCPALEEDVVCPCPEVCGDGHKVGDAELAANGCEDGNNYNGDGCSSDCKVETGWTCSGGNTFTKDQCLASSCGDGKKSGNEQCDDGNNDDHDGCDSNCKIEPYFHCDNSALEANGKTECQCMRVRKDWRNMRKDEQDLYILAVQTMKATESSIPGLNLYDAVVQTHAHLNNKNYAHGSSGFLPWHRKYLLEYENSLRSLGPQFGCVTVPYWDWAEDTDICSSNGGCETYHEKSPILQAFGGPGSMECMTYPHGGVIDCDRIPDGPIAGESWKEQCLSKCSGQTTWGSTGATAKRCSNFEKSTGACYDIPSNAVGCVTSGPFAGWMSPEYGSGEDASAPTCLSRGVNWDIKSSGYLTASMRMQEIITSYKEYGTNAGFRAYLESTPHANPHNLLGGHIRSFSSPADPLFFSHHAFIDKVWAMWQDCHDWDEIPTAEIDKRQYDASKGDFDKWDTELTFTFPPEATGEPDKCAKSNGDCAPKVHGADSWCASNDWDSACQGFCNQFPECQNAGGGDRPVGAAIPTWDASKTHPENYHSIHDLGSSNGKPNSYMYQRDEFDIKMQEQKAICDFTETHHHGKEWKGQDRRKLRAASKPESNKSVDENGRKLMNEYDLHHEMHAKHGSAPDQRTLAVAVDGNGCPYDTDGAWWSAALLEQDKSKWIDNGDGTLSPVCQTREAYENEMTGCWCECQDGMMWDIDQLYCMSIYPVDEKSQDPDTVAVIAYFDKLASKLIDDSIFVKDSDSLVDVFPKLVERECELLYNKKNNITRVDDVQELDSLKNRFLKGWGLGDSVDLGVANDPCNHIGPAGDTTVKEDSRRRLHVTA